MGGGGMAQPEFDWRDGVREKIMSTCGEVLSGDDLAGFLVHLDADADCLFWRTLHFNLNNDVFKSYVERINSDLKSGAILRKTWISAVEPSPGPDPDWRDLVRAKLDRSTAVVSEVIATCQVYLDLFKHSQSWRTLYLFLRDDDAFIRYVESLARDIDSGIRYEQVKQLHARMFSTGIAGYLLAGFDGGVHTVERIWRKLPPKVQQEFVKCRHLKNCANGIAIVLSGLYLAYNSYKIIDEFRSGKISAPVCAGNLMSLCLSVAGTVGGAAGGAWCGAKIGALAGPEGAVVGAVAGGVIGGAAGAYILSEMTKGLVHEFFELAWGDATDSAYRFLDVRESDTLSMVWKSYEEKRARCDSMKRRIKLYTAWLFIRADKNYDDWKPKTD